MRTFPRLFVAFISILVGAIRALEKSKADLVLENIALRRQVQVLQRGGARPRFDDVDRGSGRLSGSMAGLGRGLADRPPRDRSSVAPGAFP
jgi:hypothetical protein